MKEVAENENLLFRQYELYLQSIQQISEKRFKANHFYISLLSALLGILAFTFGKDNFQNLAEYQDTMVQAVSLLGLLLNLIWFFTIRSYRKLSDAKYRVINNMEMQLPFQAYHEEWETLKGHKYFLLTKMEQWLCLALTLPFITLLLLFTKA